MNDFLKDRHEAVIEAVINDKWTKVRAYCKKYGIPIPKNWKVMKARNLQNGSVLYRYSR